MTRCDLVEQIARDPFEREPLVIHRVPHGGDRAKSAGPDDPVSDKITRGVTTARARGHLGMATPDEYTASAMHMC